jgi:hypothetical protein
MSTTEAQTKTGSCAMIKPYEIAVERLRQEVLEL